MKKSGFGVLFGEDCDLEFCKKEETKANEFGIGFKIALGSFLSIMVLTFTILVNLFYFHSSSQTNTPEVLGEKVVVKSDPYMQDNSILIENSLDNFVYSFLRNNYKVNIDGAFGFIYGDAEDGLISFTEKDAYFEKGSLVFFDYGEDYKIIWDESGRKHVLLKENDEYFITTASSDFYYRHYLGQHILQDFVDDYNRNKEFITQIDENTWEWEWSFFTPIDESTDYTMRAELKIGKNFLEYIKLFNGEDEISTFEFSFEKVEGFNEKEMLKNYNQIQEPEFNLSE